MGSFWENLRRTVAKSIKRASAGEEARLKSVEGGLVAGRGKGSCCPDSAAHVVLGSCFSPTSKLSNYHQGRCSQYPPRLWTRDAVYELLPPCKSAYTISKQRIGACDSSVQLSKDSGIIEYR